MQLNQMWWVIMFSARAKWAVSFNLSRLAVWIFNLA